MNFIRLDYLQGANLEGFAAGAWGHPNKLGSKPVHLDF